MRERESGPFFFSFWYYSFVSHLSQFFSLWGTVPNVKQRTRKRAPGKNEKEGALTWKYAPRCLGDRTCFNRGPPNLVLLLKKKTKAFICIFLSLRRPVWSGSLFFEEKNSLMDLLKDNHTQPLKTFPGTFSSAKEYNNNKKKANKKSKWNLWDAFCRNLLFRIYSPGWFCCLYGLGVCGCAQKFFSFFLFVSFSQSICGWIEETGEIKRRKKILFFACECERERGGGGNE